MPLSVACISIRLERVSRRSWWRTGNGAVLVVEHVLPAAVVVQNLVRHQCIHRIGLAFQRQVLRRCKEPQFRIEEFLGHAGSVLEFTHMNKKIDTFDDEVGLLIIDQKFDPNTG